MAKKRSPTPVRGAADGRQLAKAHVQTRADYAHLLKDIKAQIQQAQTRAMLAVNAELVRLYWDIGRMIDERQKLEGWGSAVIPRLAGALHNELPEEKGFSERNIGRMIAFYRAYPAPADFLPQPVAKPTVSSNLPQAVARTTTDSASILWSVPWGHHALLLEKVQDLAAPVGTSNKRSPTAGAEMFCWS